MPVRIRGHFELLEIVSFHARAVSLQIVQKLCKKKNILCGLKEFCVTLFPLWHFCKMCVKTGWCHSGSVVYIQSLHWFRDERYPLAGRKNKTDKQRAWSWTPSTLDEEAEEAWLKPVFPITYFSIREINEGRASWGRRRCCEKWRYYLFGMKKRCVCVWESLHALLFSAAARRKTGLEIVCVWFVCVERSCVQAGRRTVRQSICPECGTYFKCKVSIPGVNTHYSVTDCCRGLR